MPSCSHTRRRGLRRPPTLSVGYLFQGPSVDCRTPMSPPARCPDAEDLGRRRDGRKLLEPLAVDDGLQLVFPAGRPLLRLPQHAPCRMHGRPQHVSPQHDEFPLQSSDLRLEPLQPTPRPPYRQYRLMDVRPANPRTATSPRVSTYLICISPLIRPRPHVNDPISHTSALLAPAWAVAASQPPPPPGSGPLCHTSPCPWWRTGRLAQQSIRTVPPFPLIKGR